MESGSPFYKVLCFWNILAVTGRSSAKIVKWVNSALGNSRYRISLTSDEQQLVSSTKDLGYYLLESCRNAIAHVIRNDLLAPHIDPNSPADQVRMWTAAGLLAELAREYVEVDLGMTETLAAYRFGARSIPEYMTYEQMRVRNSRLHRRISRIEIPPVRLPFAQAKIRASK